jgi:hypothetical protein
MVNIFMASELIKFLIKQGYEVVRQEFVQFPSIYQDLTMCYRIGTGEKFNSISSPIFLCHPILLLSPKMSTKS